MASVPDSGARQRGEQERSRVAKKRILDAALKVLVETGYSGATTLRIQEEAGVSRGRLLNYFPSRDALLVAAVHHLTAEPVLDLGSRTDWPDNKIERISAAVETMWATYAQPYFWASMELWLAARSRDDLRAALLPAERTMGAMVRESTDSFFGGELTNHVGYPELRELLNTSMRGVALTYALERRTPTEDPHLDVWKKLALETLLRPL